MSGDFEIVSPKPNQVIGEIFEISGWVPRSWFGKDAIFHSGYCLIDLNCLEFACMSFSVSMRFRDLFGKRARFTTYGSLHPLNASFINESEGRIVIAVEGINDQVVHIPVIVQGFETTVVDDMTLERHRTVGERLSKIKQDLNEYNEESAKIRNSRLDKERAFNSYSLAGLTIGSDIFKILDESDDHFDEYLYSDEDRREAELEEKYQEALNWRGPLARGLVAKFGPFEMRVHSDDHGKHFHVIHSGKRINARFSFPELKLLNYAHSQTTIGAKTEKKIREFCLQPEVFKKLESEFAKRG